MPFAFPRPEGMGLESEDNISQTIVLASYGLGRRQRANGSPPRLRHRDPDEIPRSISGSELDDLGEGGESEIEHDDARRVCFPSHGSGKGTRAEERSEKTERQLQGIPPQEEEESEATEVKISEFNDPLEGRLEGLELRRALLCCAVCMRDCFTQKLQTKLSAGQGRVQRDTKRQQEQAEGYSSRGGMGKAGDRKDSINKKAFEDHGWEIQAGFLEGEAEGKDGRISLLEILAEVGAPFSEKRSSLLIGRGREEGGGGMTAFWDPEAEALTLGNLQEGVRLVKTLEAPTLLWVGWPVRVFEPDPVCWHRKWMDSFGPGKKG
eukprot:Cvel_13085.t2-p1 / transcript=Cvel_13085.t2 / gene=Cvel_13085 / organism=Chromera_velia_CCMP2878 / gene_product=hypothetical protein / transcript_product=hypothetical protein / location=Cvel_scaffold881:33488-34840(+) / protein_length=320 / sequence_SO=supercontig / SO=protein_coding / is_pseudo=false